ncbi:hypothetical protein [Halorussus halobius]|uniref:hypothetical protein n=1 Tax=Halorussus halobius TaxID=1710537 RepID=UPI001092F0F4|nr:hypothetical protein [Halorussus halobius]
MRFRHPELRSLPVALGALVGIAGVLATPAPWPTDPVTSLVTGTYVGILAWTVVEQVPDAVDRAVDAGVHRLAGGLGLLGVVGLLGAGLLGGSPPDEGAVIRLLVFATALILVTSMADNRRGTLVREREQVRATVTAVQLRRYRVALSVAATVVVGSALSLTTGEFLAVGTVAGGVVGSTVGVVLTGREEYELLALDDHLLVRQVGDTGGTAVRWERLRDVSVEGDRLRVARGLPWPTVYAVDLSAVEDRRAVLGAFRSYPYLH